jgi:molybdopterin synthase sulfur carrier subunit
MTCPEPAPAAVRVRLFASLRELAGWSERLVPLPVSADPSPCTPLLLWRQLEIAAPPRPPATPSSPSAPPPAADHGLPPGLRVAINQRFAAPDTPLNPGDELAFLPPITGG